ncbi:MAG: hypothetical protein ED559_06450 [Phycisphaera sp.]|nr:MAG: hypothetical protein ED559_06450 [Phycisphaera sp.]
MALLSRAATVIGPTPPGTGEIQPATWLTSSNATSPTVLVAPSSSLTRFTPTSTMIAPGLTMSALTSSGTPAAAIRMSAFRVSPGMSGVCTLQEITVASARIRSTARGLPTTLPAPTTTATLPLRSISVDSIIRIAARAVQGTRLDLP